MKIEIERIDNGWLISYESGFRESPRVTIFFAKKSDMEKSLQELLLQVA